MEIMSDNSKILVNNIKAIHQYTGDWKSVKSGHHFKYLRSTQTKDGTLVDCVMRSGEWGHRLWRMFAGGWRNIYQTERKIVICYVMLCYDMIC